MRFVPTRLHGAVDYAWGAALLLAPGLPAAPPGPLRRGAHLPGRRGGRAVAYAALTDYELGLVPALTMREHLALDVAGGAALAASPWLLGFSNRIRWPHLGFGLFAVAAGLLTRTRPGRGAALAAPAAGRRARARLSAGAPPRLRRAATADALLV